MKEVFSIESDLYMHMQQLHETEYHYLNVVPDSWVESAHREILSLAIDLDCMIITQLKRYLSTETSLIQLSIQCVVLSAREVGLEVILNKAFILFSLMP